MVPRSRRNRFAERHSIPIRAAVQAPFPAPWCGSPTLHASRPGSDAVGHVEGCNFTARTDIPDPGMRTVRNGMTREISLVSGQLDVDGTDRALAPAQDQ